MSPYESEGSYTSESREVAVSETWDTWSNPQASSNVVVVDGALQLAEMEAPPSGVARWTFDDSDTSGSTATDTWGSFDGTINGATTGASGANQTYPTAESYSFDGTDDYVSCGSPLDSTQSFSVACWVIIDAGQACRIVNTNNNTNGVRITYGIGGAGQAFHFAIEDSDTLTEINSSEINIGQWYHVTATFSGSDITLYLDGSQVDAATGASSGGDPETLMLGAYPADSQYLDGRIDDPRIYDKELTSTEVSDLYNTGSI